MRILKVEDDIKNYIDNNIACYYGAKSLIPFLGAGFTKGCRARKNFVPDGELCSKMMKKLIVAQVSEIEDEMEEIKEFDKIANYFYRLVPKEFIQDFLNDNFTSVTLDNSRKDFINFSWPHIYTLNIDDSIERNSGYVPVLPNRKVNRKYLNKVVFKLHGDANDEVTYLKDNDGVIFSRKQYLQSLTDNKDLLNILLEDYSTYNLLLIGCSLENEIDLEYILANNKGTTPVKTDKIYVTSQEPTGLKKINLSEFGINICLVVESYPKFYKQIIETLSITEVENENAVEKYLVKESKNNTSIEFNKRIICGEEELAIFKNNVTLPSFFSHRDLTDKVVDFLKSENILFIVGKRVSGKTFLIYDLITTLRNQKVYLIPSKVSFDSNLIESLTQLDNSIIVFDTDSILASDIEDIYYRISTFRQNNIKFIFAINSSDRLMVSVPYTRAIDSEIIEIPNFFSHQEISKINYSLSRLGLANFKSNWNILNNIVNYKIIYRKIEQELSKLTIGLDERSLKIFILNAVFDKIYSSLYRALKIDYDILKYTVENSNKSLEFEFELSAIERGQHSNYKIITNSKSFIFSILGAYIYKNQTNLSAAANAVVSIVSQLKQYDSFKNYWKSLVSFDNLNQIFYYKGIGGAIKLIFFIYERLEPILFEDSHYWMQRAKSIYYLKRDDAKALQMAVEYTKKPYFDSPDYTRIKTTSSFQLAMIYNRISALQDFSDSGYLNETVDWFTISLNENEHNLRIVSSFLDDAKQKKTKHDFYNFCIYILNHPKLVDKKKREFLLGKLFDRNFTTLE